MDYRQKMDLKTRSRPGTAPLDESMRLQKQRKRIEDERMNQPYRGSRNTIIRTVLSWAFQIILVIMFAYVLVYFFGQSRTIVGQSMDTTLTGGDVVLINVMAYQMSGPERGDIISFKPGGNNSSHSSIKRVIGLPGETIQIVDGMIQIDGSTYLEQRNFPVMTNPGMATDPIKLGDMEYFVLGDNRNNSEDSRFADVGPVSADMIEGKVWFILNPSEHRGLVKK